MPNINEREEMPRKALTVFYILDTSGSMAGDKISKLNHAMEETTAALSELAKKNGDAILKIAVLQFNTGAKWETINGPENLEEDFEYEYLQAGGLTDIGAALEELDSKLSKHEFLNSITGNLMPIMIFMTDGYATDDYEKALNRIRNNKWFRRGIKIGFALGDDADDKMIASVVGNSEAVIKTNDLVVFEKLIKFVSVTTSMMVSESHTKDKEPTGADIVKQAIENIEDDKGKADTSHLNENQYLKEEIEENDNKKEGEDGDGWDDEDDWK